MHSSLDAILNLTNAFGIQITMDFNNVIAQYKVHRGMAIIITMGPHANGCNNALLVHYWTMEPLSRVYGYGICNNAYE